MIDKISSFGIIIACSAVGIIYALFNAWMVNKVQPLQSKDVEKALTANDENLKQMELIGELVRNGSDNFLGEEYKFLSIFLAIFSVVIYLAVDG